CSAPTSSCSASSSTAGGASSSSGGARSPTAWWRPSSAPPVPCARWWDAGPRTMRIPRTATTWWTWSAPAMWTRSCCPLRCLPLGCRVRSEADFHEDTFRAVPVAQVSPEWMLGRGWDASDHLTTAVKRMGDVALAFTLVLLTAPLQLLLALLVKLSGRGPAFYRQTRVGQYGRPFSMLKLRTMRVDAENGEARWAQGDDPRQTGLGRILRRTRLDELPQLLNILRGEMSFVGPRPERPEFVATLEK